MGLAAGSYRNPFSGGGMDFYGTAQSGKNATKVGRGGEGRKLTEEKNFYFTNILKSLPMAKTWGGKTPSDFP